MLYFYMTDEMNDVPEIQVEHPKPKGLFDGLKSMFGIVPPLRPDTRISEMNQRCQRAIVKIAEVLKAHGVKFITCGYDGGFDEGCAQLESMVTDKGTLSAAEAC